MGRREAGSLVAWSQEKDMHGEVASLCKSQGHPGKESDFSLWAAIRPRRHLRCSKRYLAPAGGEESGTREGRPCDALGRLEGDGIGTDPRGKAKGRKHCKAEIKTRSRQN